MNTITKISAAIATTAIFALGVATPTQAATFSGANGTSFDFGTGKWKFTFLYSYGAYQSTFSIEPPVEAVKIVETDHATPGACTICFGTYDFSTPDSKFKYVNDPSNPTNPTVLSLFADGAASDKFIFVTSSNYTGGTGVGETFEGIKSVDPTNVSLTPTPGTPSNAIRDLSTAFFAGGANSNKLILGINDAYTGDRDWNDMILVAEEVPEPVTILGTLTALGAGYVMKRRQKQQASKAA